MCDIYLVNLLLSSHENYIFMHLILFPSLFLVSCLLRCVLFTQGTCGGPCCNRETEDRLRHQARADFHNLIHHHSRTLQGLLATTAGALRGKSFFPFFFYSLRRTNVFLTLTRSTFYRHSILDVNVHHFNAFFFQLTRWGKKKRLKNRLVYFLFMLKSYDPIIRK